MSESGALLTPTLNTPCCVAEYIYKLYTAPKKDISPTPNAKTQCHLTLHIKIIISPAKLGVGGAAILEIENKNHHTAINGITDKLPLINNILREPKR